MPTVDAQPDEVGSNPVTGEDAPKSHRVFSRLQLELSEDELNSPGAQKLLLEILGRAEAEVVALTSFRGKFYEADKRNGILEEKLKAHKATEAVSIACLTIGGASVGYAWKVWSLQPVIGGVFLTSGAVLIVIGIVAKVIRK